MGAGEGQGRVRRRSRRAQGLPPPEDWRVRGLPPPEGWRDWKGGLPDAVLAKVAATLVAQDEAAYEAHLKERYRWMTEEEIQEEIQEGTEELEEEDLEHIQWEMAKRKEDLERIQEQMAKRKRDGNCLFVFARVCREWRKAQLKVGGPLRTRVPSDVILPGSVALVNWALREGCPRFFKSYNMARVAAQHGHRELLQWLCRERAWSWHMFGAFAMDADVMSWAAMGGNLDLVRWLRGEGCPWDKWTCYFAAQRGHVETLRWARENGCPWDAYTRDRAARELGYTDDLGNLVL